MAPEPDPASVPGTVLDAANAYTPIASSRAITETTTARVRETRMNRTERSPYSGMWFQRRLVGTRGAVIGDQIARRPPPQDPLKGDPTASRNDEAPPEGRLVQRCEAQLISRRRACR